MRLDPGELADLIALIRDRDAWRRRAERAEAVVQRAPVGEPK